MRLSDWVRAGGSRYSKRRFLPISTEGIDAELDKAYPRTKHNQEVTHKGRVYTRKFQPCFSNSMKTIWGWVSYWEEKHIPEGLSMCPAGSHGGGSSVLQEP